MDTLGLSVNKAAIRLAISSLLFLLVQMGWIDPIIANQYREQIVDIVSAVMVAMFALEFVAINIIKMYHRIKHDPEYVEQPGMILTLVNKVLGKYITATSNFRLFKSKTSDMTVEPSVEVPPQEENPQIAG